MEICIDPWRATSATQDDLFCDPETCVVQTALRWFFDGTPTSVLPMKQISGVIPPRIPCCIPCYRQLIALGKYTPDCIYYDSHVDDSVLQPGVPVRIQRPIRLTDDMTYSNIQVLTFQPEDLPTLQNPPGLFAFLCHELDEDRLHLLPDKDYLVCIATVAESVLHVTMFDTNALYRRLKL